MLDVASVPMVCGMRLCGHDSQVCMTSYVTSEELPNLSGPTSSQVNNKRKVSITRCWVRILSIMNGKEHMAVKGLTVPVNFFFFIDFY